MKALYNNAGLCEGRPVIPPGPPTILTTASHFLFHEMNFFLIFFGFFPFANALATRCVALKKIADNSVQVVQLEEPLKIGDAVSFNVTARPQSPFAIISFYEGSPKKHDPKILVSLHVKVNLNSSKVIFNTMAKSGWFKEEPRQTTVKHGSDFKIDIKVLETAYAISLNGKLIYTYNYRVPTFRKVQAIGFQGIQFRDYGECPAKTGEKKEGDSKYIIFSNGIVEATDVNRAKLGSDPSHSAAIQEKPKPISSTVPPTKNLKNVNGTKVGSSQSHANGIKEKPKLISSTSPPKTNRKIVNGTKLGPTPSNATSIRREPKRKSAPVFFLSEFLNPKKSTPTTVKPK
ncbi:unnamed protein product [Caenorhabditis auriculariae]|uniref:Galectin n=1 Tax=Caenorhabditis auriculariae TaxID=2777116 RepID=A0A8S1H3A8_9PELO|nr:unnamed protein product [Caenorhabditis auriculariae]